MASIARCLRPSRPALVSILAQSSRSRPALASLSASNSSKLRLFSATAISKSRADRCNGENHPLTKPPTCLKDPIRRYTKDHEWIDLNADKTAGVIGISDYAAEALGDVVYVELPEEGKEVRAGDAIGAVESVKSAADINAPVACRVTHVNMALEEKPATINQVPEDDSHGGGWIAKVEVGPEGQKDFERLMDAEAYKAFTAAEQAE
jgi:glycine cleavage system H protein